jgi:hypothetical protein
LVSRPGLSLFKEETMIRRIHPATAWRMLKIAIFFAIGFSSWAALSNGACSSCDGAGEVFGGKSLAALGIVYYSILFVAAAALGPSLFVYSGVLLAAGIHGGLLVILAHAGILCIPCVCTALAALAALVAALRCDSSNALRASFMIPGAAFAVQAAVLLSGAVPAIAQGRAEPEAVAREEFGSAPVARGHVRLVVYTRPDCGYCIQLERDVMPGLVRDFGERLLVERRSAEQLPGIPTPTLILTGGERRRLIPGLPELEDLRKTIRELMGESHGR